MPGKGAVTKLNPTPIKPANAIAKLRTGLEKPVYISSCADLHESYDAAIMRPVKDASVGSQSSYPTDRYHPQTKTLGDQNDKAKSNLRSRHSRLGA